MGEPKRTVQTMGTGSAAPLGNERCRLSRYTGINSTCGNSLASRNSPVRKRAGVALAPRVPSGKMISESPSRNATRRGSSGSTVGSVFERSMSTAPSARVAMYLRKPEPQ
jgi:hypothetical protein